MHSHTAHPDPFGAGLNWLLAACVVANVAYLAAAVLPLRHSGRWSDWRISSFVFGMALVIAALSPPLATLGHHDLRVHMVQHLMLGMLGPVFIVFGAPVTLALRSLKPPRARALVAALRSAPLRWLGHPVPALVLNLGGMVALYATPLFSAMHESPALHALVHFHFLAAGCLFSWSIAGADPAPHRPSHRLRLGVLFAAMAGHAMLAKAMYAQRWPAGTASSIQEIEQAAQIMYYGGDLAELLLALALFATWPRRSRASSVEALGTRPLA